MPLVLPAPSVEDTPVNEYTVAHLVEDVFTHLDETSFGVLNKSTGDVQTDGTLIPYGFNNQEAIRPGAYICIDVEVMYVWQVLEDQSLMEVQRGMMGSEVAEHAAGALIQVSPRVSNYDVFKELRNEINSWPPDLYRAVRLPVSVGTTTRTYDFAAANAYRVLQAKYRRTAASPVDIAFREDYNADTDVYPSGKTITFDTSFSSGSVDVVYATPFQTTPWDLTTTMSEIGLSNSMLDIPVLGAAARLIREAPRTDTTAQGQSRLADEVPPGHRMNTRANLRRERDDRIHQEKARLREVYPLRRA